MNDAPTRYRQIDRSRIDNLMIAQTVSVSNLTIEKVRSGGEVDVGSGEHIDAGSRWTGERARVVEKHPVPHTAQSPMG